jgi:hypothetical protein
MPKKKTYQEASIGMSVYQHPSQIDDCLNRSILTAQRLTGTGNQSIPVDTSKHFGHPISYEVGLTKIPKAVNEAGDVAVNITYDAANKKFDVTATATCEWAGTAIFQRADNDP